MDTRTGIIYDNIEAAKAAGVPDEDLVTGSKPALEKLQAKIRTLDQRGSFKNVSITPQEDFGMDA
jgi:hypothetical protein